MVELGYSAHKAVSQKLAQYTTGDASGPEQRVTGAGGEKMKERIAVNPNIHFGKPCVAGTRIPVQNVLELVSEGLPFEDIIRDYYPDLQIEDIRACVLFAIDVSTDM
jgi:uncharacterized protein (DUF433 family)